ncbi:MAG: Ig-like domain repeat protein [Solirubrobacterales bacterium]
MAASASAASPLLIREAYPGSAGAPLAEYVVLQTLAPGQNDVEGQLLRFYDATGQQAGSYELEADVPNPESQRTVLLATEEAVSVPGGGSPDFTLPSQGLLDPAGGAVCLSGPDGSDCVAWGSAPIFPQGSGFPDPQAANAAPGGISDGVALRRLIEPGCPTFLDPADDAVRSSEINFELRGPAPRSNSVEPSEQPCVPNSFIMTFPRSPINETSASFTYEEYPPDPAIHFDCALDWPGELEPADFSPCPGKSIHIAGPLSDGEHRLSVRASGQGGVDPTPDVFTWVVDTVPPRTSIFSTPPNPSWGFRLNYTYRSSETESGYHCQLDSGPIQVCTEAGHDYFQLADGPHTFRVWATDNAGNKDPTAAEHTVMVDNRIGDRTPPKTTIVSAPPPAVRDSSASFAYASSEPGSTFECRIAPKPFVPCPVEGTTYRDLPNSPYRFEVRATDRAGNVDAVPAQHAWRVAKPAPRTRFTRAPGGVLRRGQPARFAFAASSPAAGFRCRLDLKGAFRRCRSPHRIKAAPGRHVLEVYAVDRLGNSGGGPAIRIFRVRSKQRRSWFAQAGKLLSSFEAQIAPTKLPRKRLAPVSLRFASAFENLDGTDTPELRSMTLKLAKGGVVQSRGLPRCRMPQLRFATSSAALGACRRAKVGEGAVTTALRFPEGSRIRFEAKLLLFNAAGNRVLMHIHARRPVATTIVVPIEIRSGARGTVLHARFPKIAGGNGFLTGFRMKLERTYRHRGKRRSYLAARCPIPSGAGLRRIAFQLGRISYRFGDGRTLRNSSFNTCSVRGS